MRALAFAVILIGALALCGCGSGGQSDLSGEVTLDGSPLERGSILLVPKGPTGTATGCEIKAGKYVLTGPQAPKHGTYRVQISASKKSGRRVQKAMGKPGELEDEVVEAVAARFNTKTELTVEVKSGGGEQNFAVRSR
jgi:hypothetical protein